MYFVCQNLFVLSLGNPLPTHTSDYRLIDTHKDRKETLAHKHFPKGSKFLQQSKVPQRFSETSQNAYWTGKPG